MSKKSTQELVRKLRIGVLLGGKLIEERVVDSARPITLGQSASCDLVVPMATLPRRYQLFDSRDGEFILRLHPQMDARLSEGSEVRSAGDLRKGQLPGPVEIGLASKTTRGKLSWGKLTLLFQIVDAPLVAAQPRLPASVRGTLSQRINGRLAALVAASVFFHGTVTVWAHVQDPARDAELEQIHQTFEQDRYNARTARLVVLPKPDTGTGATIPTPTTPPDVSAPPPKQIAQRPSGGNGNIPRATRDPNDTLTIDQRVDNSALLKVLTGNGGNSRYSKMSETDPGADLAAQINNTRRSVRTVSSNTPTRGPRGDRSGTIGTSDTPRLDVGGGGPTEAKEEEELRSRPKIGAVEDLIGTSLSPDAVSRKIRSRYLTGIKRCHTQALKRNPEAGGRVNLSFTVSIAGRVVKSSVRGFDPTVDSCIKRLTRNWRFSAPDEEAAFELPLILTQ